MDKCFHSSAMNCKILQIHYCNYIISHSNENYRNKFIPIWQPFSDCRQNAVFHFTVFVAWLWGHLTLSRTGSSSIPSQAPGDLTSSLPRMYIQIGGVESLVSFVVILKCSSALPCISSFQRTKIFWPRPVESFLTYCSCSIRGLHWSEENVLELICSSTCHFVYHSHHLPPICVFYKFGVSRSTYSEGANLLLCLIDDVLGLFQFCPALSCRKLMMVLRNLIEGSPMF